MAYPRPDEVGEILVTSEQIAARVAELGAAISADLHGRTPLLVGILKGSVVFVADLMRAIDGPVDIDFMAVSSYGDDTQSSGVVKIVKDLDDSIVGRDVVLVEDIIDSGLTMRFLQEHLKAQRPASLRTCAFLVRAGRTHPGVDIDYVGFELPPSFVVGFGLDAKHKYRNLPYIATYTGD